MVILYSVASIWVLFILYWSAPVALWSESRVKSHNEKVLKQPVNDILVFWGISAGRYTHVHVDDNSYLACYIKASIHTCKHEKLSEPQLKFLSKQVHVCLTLRATGWAIDEDPCSE